MQRFTIRDIEHLTGIKAHTLRIWEQRYGFFTPKRKESMHRFYENEDLKKLLRISVLYHSGWKISRIAALDDEAVVQQVREIPVSSGYQVYVNRLIEAALDFSEHRFLTELNGIIDQIGFEACVVQVCYPYLVKVGHLWSANNLIPAQEHFSSYLIQNRIIVETEKIPVTDSPPEIVLISPQGEYHELSLLFIHYMLRKKGWATVYLGTNVRNKELEQVTGLDGIRTIYVHLITNFTGADTDDYFENLCRAFPNKQIYASGGGVRKVQRSFVNLTILQRDEQIYRFINREPIL